MAKKLVIATRNKNKLEEIKNIFLDLGESGIEVVGLDEAGVSPDFNVEEPASTYEGNAILKAILLGQKSNSIVLADDSGLEVDALDGRPGVYSARYGGGNSMDGCNKILAELKDVSDEKRGAQFVCVMAVYDPQSSKIRTCQKYWTGKIIHEVRGSNGHGYDPIFLNELGKTNAEVTSEEKNKISHRYACLKEIIPILKNEFGY